MSGVSFISLKYVMKLQGVQARWELGAQLKAIPVHRLVKAACLLLGLEALHPNKDSSLKKKMQMNCTLAEKEKTLLNEQASVCFVFVTR